MKNIVYLSIGSNIGNREINILKSLIILEKRGDTEVIDVSNFYETEPVGYSEQDIFVNCAAKIKTKLKPYELLKVLKETEEQLGREMLFRWGPRNIDLDIVFYENLKIKSDILQIPHKEYKNRNFVLTPTFELCKKIEVIKYLKRGKGYIGVKKEKKIVGISSCLIGVNSKYSGGNNYNKLFKILNKNFIFVPICPEQIGGLSTPRTASEILEEKVITKTGRDVTYEFKKGADESFKIMKSLNANFAILKSRSPSCGYGEIYDGSFSGVLKKGNGITADLLEKNGIEIIEF